MFRFTLKSPTTPPIELTAITPDELAGKSLAEVERLSIWHGRTQVTLADLFAIARNDKDDQLEFVGDLSSSVGLGAELKSGSIRIAGHVGRNVGLGMWGGEVEVIGNAGDGLGTGMRGGIIRLHGSAGDFVGAAQVGSTRGMTGGAILIDGDTGNGVGTRLRRGLIAIGGRAGDFVGHHMLAGTIIVGGECGQHFGTGMSRGTIALLKPTEANLPPTFRYACVAHSPMLGLVGRELQSLGLENDVWNANRQWQQFSGDFLVSGRGEVFLG